MFSYKIIIPNSVNSLCTLYYTGMKMDRGQEKIDVQIFDIYSLAVWKCVRELVIGIFWQIFQFEVEIFKPNRKLHQWKLWSYFWLSWWTWLYLSFSLNTSQRRVIRKTRFPIIFKQPQVFKLHFKIGTFVVHNAIEEKVQNANIYLQAKCGLCD